jgi:hypothetical protein
MNPTSLLGRITICAAQNFESFQIFKTEIKNQKPKAVDVLFRAYLAGRYL